MILQTNLKFLVITCPILFYAPFEFSPDYFIQDSKMVPIDGCATCLMVICINRKDTAWIRKDSWNHWSVSNNIVFGDAFPKLSSRIILKIFLFFICLQLYLIAEIANGDEQVTTDAIRIGNYVDGQYPTDSREFAKRVFYTVFMGSENRWLYYTQKNVSDQYYILAFILYNYIIV